jgi:1-acyl-sn-glycerol-3-phosphate acyltransferase
MNVMNEKKQRDLASDDAGQATAHLLTLIQAISKELHPGQSSSGRPVTLDSRLDMDLGFDSLGRVELISRIEREFGINLADHIFASAETPRDLRRTIMTANGERKLTPSSTVDDSTLGPVEIAPHSAQTLVEVLAWHVSHHPDRPHIRLYRENEEDEIISYRQLNETALAVAAGLQQTGLQPGETVTLMLPTGRDYFFSFFGVLYAGGIPVPIYPPARPTQLEDHLRRQVAVLNNCRAVMLITVPEARQLAQLLRAQVISLRSVTTVDELSGVNAAYHRPSIGSQDIAFLQYTSGSTGNPKGVILTHDNLLANIRADGEAIKAKPSDVFVSWLPLYHDMGLIGAWLATLYFAARLVIMSPLNFLAHPQRWLWAIHRYGGTLSASPNFGYELCLRRIDENALEGLNLSRWRVAFNGAEAISAETMERFSQRFARYGFRTETMFPVYGLAESSLGLAFPPLNHPPRIDHVQRKALMNTGKASSAVASEPHALHFVCCGRPLAGHQIRIVDRADRELPERHQGRLQFRGPSSTSGYFRNPEATATLFHGEWLDSGDLAYMAAGEVYITGRVKDIIIRAGRNIYPEEVEEIVGNIEGIRKGRVAVFGSMDPKSGTERLIVLAETHEKETEILNRLRAQIQALAIDLVWTPPDDVVLASPNTVLKTSSGKIRRTACRELYERGEIGRKQRTVWWQVVRLVLSGLSAQLRRLGRVATYWLYALYTWALLRVLALITFIVVLLLPVSRGRWGAMRMAARTLARSSGTSLTVRGLEHLPAANTPCIYVANHASYLDAYALAAAIPHPVSFVAKSELTRNPLLRIFLRRIRTVFVNRFDREQVLMDAQGTVQTARTGRSLLFFPEGTFTRIAGLQPFHMGAFVAAAEASLPVIPIAIRGTRNILPAGSRFARHGSIAITIGRSLDPSTVGKKAQSADPWQIALQLRDAARTHILRYCGEPDLSDSVTGQS